MGKEYFFKLLCCHEESVKENMPKDFCNDKIDPVTLTLLISDNILWFCLFVYFMWGEGIPVPLYTSGVHRTISKDVFSVYDAGPKE